MIHINRHYFKQVIFCSILITRSDLKASSFESSVVLLLNGVVDYTKYDKFENLNTVEL